jgi:hypothetical protein
MSGLGTAACDECRQILSDREEVVCRLSAFTQRRILICFQHEQEPALEALLQQAPLPERNLIERFFSKLKHFRRVAARYDKLAANFLAMVQLASMRLWLRAYESTA